MLHNFAGNIEMYGILDAIALGPIEACTSENSTMDKNRDVIVAFPDVDPSVILIPEIFEERKLVHFSRQLSEREPLKETTNSYDQPHLWYSTADVTRALVLFLENGYDVSDSQTFR
ncbi:unnamed protein product [Musa hybrid cultivar]